jgi:cytochrome c-type biogenesis protein CcmH/NrfG
LLRMAYLYQYEHKDTKSAERLLTSIVRRNPTNHAAWYQLGVILQEQGLHERAAECLSAALVLEDTSPILPFTLLPIEL